MKARLMGDRLRERRRILGLSVPELMHKLWNLGLRISSASIYGWEQRPTDIKASHLLYLSRALRCRPEWLYGLEEEKDDVQVRGTRPAKGKG